MEKQQIPKIDPYGVVDATGLGAKAAGPIAQCLHHGGQFVNSKTDLRGHGDGSPENPAMGCQQAGQGAV
jgi:hypothetical protein